jgi:hypothetical protein
MIKGLERIAIRRRATILPEPDSLDSFDRGADASGDQLVRFRDVRNAFSPLEGWDSRLHDELVSSMNMRDRRLAARTEDSVIGVHVRRGDFYVVSEAELASWEGPRGALRTPTRWFVESVALVRKLLGRTAPVFVVSDGEPNELELLLALDGVTLLRGGSPISDLIALSNAKILIGSMESSFTAWASFLGQMTTCTFPVPTERFPFVNRKGLYTGALDPGADPAADLIRDIRRLRP